MALWAISEDFGLLFYLLLGLRWPNVIPIWAHVLALKISKKIVVGLGFRVLGFRVLGDHKNKVSSFCHMIDVIGGGLPGPSPLIKDWGAVAGAQWNANKRKQCLPYWALVSK